MRRAGSKFALLVKQAHGFIASDIHHLGTRKTHMAVIESHQKMERYISFSAEPKHFPLELTFEEMDE